MGRGAGLDRTESSSSRNSFGAERGPRPEATALKWHELLPTTQDALEELINWLYAASNTSVSDDSDSHRRENEEQLATSALVSGDRGFGKTTLLLTSAYALRAPEEFFGRELRGGAGDEDSGGEESQDRLQVLGGKLKKLHNRLVWLDTLDMEPIPAQANLLATLLVRVRNALDLGRDPQRRDRWAPPSLLEEGLDDPYGKLDKLVRDATFMWEDIPAQGQDPRQRADQQIKAAEIYANFRQDFFKTMDGVSRLLAARRFGHPSTERVLLVLPIDNVDRSTQHLHLILKLTRMVASRRLWFVLASGRSEFQLFLERTFQAELASAGQTPLGPRAREETLSIARRQAAAAMRRVLPPIHRIQIDSVTPRAAWRFQAAPILAGDAPDSRCLSDFLKELRLPGCTRRSPSLKHFADLFDVRRRLSEPVRQAYRQLLREHFTEDGKPGSQDEPIFTYAARLALTLSARTALDLWQALKSAYQQNEKHRKEVPGHDDAPCDGCAERVIDIAESMLRSAIDESELPAWASEQLLNRIMRRNTQNHVVLDLTGRPVRKLKRTTLSNVLEWNPQWSRPGPDGAEPERLLRTELHLRHFQDDIFELHDLDKPGRTVPLPPSVAGWFMLLHDLLVLTRQGRVLNFSFIPLETTPELVVTVHQAKLEPAQLIELDFWWLPPSWNTFIDFSLFVIQWRAFLHRIDDLFKLPAAEFSHGDSAKEFAAARFDFLMAAWIDNVCSVAHKRRGKWSWRGLSKVVPGSEVVPARAFDGAELQRYLLRVAFRAELLFKRARKQSDGYDRLWIARLWLEQTLPLMLHPEFLPPPFLERHEGLLAEVKKRCTHSLWESIWKETNPFIEARRQELIRATLERSRAFQAWREASGGTSGSSARSLRSWLQSASDAWLSAVGDTWLDTVGDLEKGDLTL